ETVTVTTPSRLNERPSYHGLAGDPATNPPPWIHTSTGNRACGSGAGVNTLTLRVEVPGIVGSGIAVTSENGTRCGVGPYAVAGCTPCHGGWGRGEPNRSSPTGGAANGIPRNAAEAAPRSSRQNPRTAPASVTTTGSPRSTGIPGR